MSGMTEEDSDGAFINSIDAQDVHPGYDRARWVGLHHHTLIGAKSPISSKSNRRPPGSQGRAFAFGFRLRDQLCQFWNKSIAPIFPRPRNPARTQHTPGNVKRPGMIVSAMDQDGGNAGTNMN